MHPRRGVEAVTALLWLASGRFLAGIGRVIAPNLSKAAQPKSVYGTHGQQLRVLSSLNCASLHRLCDKDRRL